MSADSSSPATSKPDRTRAILARVGLLDDAEDFDDFVFRLQDGKPPSDKVLAVALVALLMAKSSVSRQAISVLLRDLGSYIRDEPRKEQSPAQIVLLDGVFLFLPSSPEGAIYRLPELTKVAPVDVGPYLTLTAWSLHRALELVKGT